MAKESHNYDHSHAHHNISTKNIKLAFVLNSIFTVVEFFVGIYSNSVTISSSAIHDFGDSIILFFALLLEKKSGQGRNSKYTYGYARFSLLGNLINTIVLLLGGVIIIQNGINRLLNPEEIHEIIMIFFSCFGILVNGYGAYKLFDSKSEKNSALFLNIFADFFAWISILFSAIVALVFHIYFLDALLSLCIAIWLIFEGLKNARNIFNILMQAVPKELNQKHIKDLILSNRIVCEMHDFHVWNLDGEDYISSFHIIIDSENLEEIMSVKEEIKLKLEKVGINHSTIEIDTIKQASLNGEYNNHENTF